MDTVSVTTVPPSAPESVRLWAPRRPLMKGGKHPMAKMPKSMSSTPAKGGSFGGKRGAPPKRGK